MLNWAGQDIDLGIMVWRGARDGNTSSVKIGKVLDGNFDTNKVKVNWLFEPGGTWLMRNVPEECAAANIVRINSTGWCDVNYIVHAPFSEERLIQLADRRVRLLDRYPWR